MRNLLRKNIFYFRQSVQNLLRKAKYTSWIKWRFASHVAILRQAVLLPYSTLPWPTPWEKLHPAKVPKRIIVEIGTGHGENIAYQAGQYPASLYVGFEWASRFARMSASRAEKSGLPNVKIIRAHGYEALEQLFPDNSLSEIHILFPDPWHKKKHHKRRPITREFFALAAQKLQPGGRIIIATDWPEYYEFIGAEARYSENLFSWKTGDDYSPAKFDLAPTHYYRKWQKKGRTFYWLELTAAK